MEENTCQLVPSSQPVLGKCGGDWKTLAISGGLVLLFCILSYFLYRFIQHTNKRMRSVEQALHNLNNHINEREKARQQAPPPPPPQFFMHPETIVLPHAVPPPVVVADSKTLDKELSEELKELVPTSPADKVVEGRVEDTEDTKA